MRLALANAWIYGALTLSSLLLLLLFLPWLIVGRLRGMSVAAATREAIWVYGRVSIVAMRPFVSATINIAGAMKRRGAAIVVANHQSALDIYLLAIQDAPNVCLLSRSWPFRRLFFFRPLMRAAGYVETETVSPEEMFAQCRRELEAGNLVIGFPEGTRSPDGRLGRFHSGLFKLAEDTGFPVTPLVIHGSHGVLPKGSCLFRPGKVSLEILPPVDPTGFSGELIPHGAMRRHVRRLFAERLEAESKGEIDWM